MTELGASVVKTPIKFLINQTRKGVAKRLFHGDEGDRGLANVIYHDAEHKTIKQTNLRASACQFLL